MPATTIRYYEKIGLLPEPARISGQRIYDPEILPYLEAVATAQDLGFTLGEIKLLLGSFHAGETPSPNCRDLAQQKLRELDELITNAHRMKGILEHGLTCNCTSLQGCYVSERP